MPRSTAFGNAFETWFVNECHKRISYLENDYRLSYLRTKDDVEVDLIIERPGKPEVLIEINRPMMLTSATSAVSNIFPRLFLAQNCSASQP